MRVYVLHYLTCEGSDSPEGVFSSLEKAIAASSEPEGNWRKLGYGQWAIELDHYYQETIEEFVIDEPEFDFKSEGYEGEFDTPGDYTEEPTVLPPHFQPAPVQVANDNWDPDYKPYPCHLCGAPIKPKSLHNCIYVGGSRHE